MKHLLLFCSMFLSLQTAVFSQTDTEFWFAVPYISKNHSGGMPAYLRISSKAATTVQISQPANDSPDAFSATLNMAANTTQSIDLSTYLMALTDSFPNQKGDNALFISSSQPISVYYEFSSPNNAEVFILKGNRNALGREFYTPFQNFWDNDQNPDMNTDNPWFKNDAHSTLDIVAVEDGTEITITPSQAGFDNFNGVITNRPKDVSYTISLNRGETYTLQAASDLKGGHMSGTHITSNKDIAVSFKDDTLKEGEGLPGRIAGDLTGKLDYGYDVIGDQLVPVNVVGADYIVVKGFSGYNQTGARDRVFIVVTENNTRLTVNGVPRSDVYNEGDTVSFNTGIIGDAVFISARDIADPSIKKNIYVYHVTGIAYELSGALLPSVFCTGSDTVSFTRSTKSEFTLNILVRKDGELSFKINGKSNVILPSDFEPVPNTGGEQWVYARFTNEDIAARFGTDIDSGKVTTITNDQYYFHMNYMNGQNFQTSRYGYFSDFGNFKINFLSNNNSKFCQGATDTIVVPNANRYKSIFWTDEGNGEVLANGAKYVPKPQPGTLRVRIIDRRECEAEDFTITSFHDPVVVELGDPEIFFCFGDKTIATANIVSGGTRFNYFWNDDKRPYTKNDTTLTIAEEGSLPWSVMALNLDNNCRGNDAAVYHLRKRLPDPELADSAVTCFNNPVPISVKVNPEFTQYEWFYKETQILGENGSSILAARKGEYKVKVFNDKECARIDSIEVDSVGDFALNIPSDAAFCENLLNPPKLDAGPGEGYDITWAPSGSKETTYTPTNTGTYSVVKISNYGGCRKEASSNITYVNIASTGIGDTLKCPEKPITLVIRNSDQFKDILWADGKTTPTYQVPANGAGRYIVNFKTIIGGCDNVDTIQVNNFAIDTLDLGADTTVCNYDNFLLDATDKYKSYSWSPDNSDGTSIYKPTTKGFHNLTVLDSNNCEQRDLVLVTVIEIVDPPIGPDTTLCAYHEFMYMVSPSSYDSYVWQDGSIDFKYIPKYNDTIIHVEVIRKENGVTCFQRDTANVKVIAPINVSFNEFETPICSDDRFELKALVDRTIYNGEIKSYLWLDRGKTPADTLGRESFIVPNASRIYTVVVTGENDCFGSFKDDVLYFDSVPAVLPDPIICDGTPFTFDPGRGFESFEWTAFSGDSLITFKDYTDSIQTTTTPGTYKVLLRSRCGVDSASGTLTYKPNPLTRMRDFQYCPDVTKRLFINADTLEDHPSYLFEWKESGNPTVINTSQAFFPNNGGTFYVSVADTNGCSKLDTITVNLYKCFEIPNLITPNGDEHNQVFEVKGIFPDTWTLKVFNRWGDKVYEGEGYNNTWDANNVSDGVYYYILENPKEKADPYKGWLQIIGRGN